ncbi:MAG TPA: phosphoribosylformylglycinamidine synthase subunit PurL [Acidimicrobiales bacterium]|nr:phosphoribosylformylglycinamidine synthase subunit PurL [Acidimicrobiales bacterium]
MVSDTSSTEADAEPGLHRALGLTDDEAASITAILGRLPNSLELAMYSVMWSEHCSYKSTRTHLSRLPTKAPWVLVGPGENAGVVDAGNGVAVALRIESHNHPSAIEPYQGAATGVGGILRDIFTMGARPIAVLDSLHFGPLDDAHGRWLLEGVVNGISGYGNAVGVPTVGGEIAFDPGFAENPLVNVMCVGVMRQDRLVLASASEPGDLAVLLGSTTGRDGIGGVSILASAGFNDGEESAAKRPSVQVGDPFEEKRLIEACLALYDAGLVAGIQDLGGAGLTCATSETASRGGTGMDVDLTAVPLRQSGMTPAEIMTSESQERMLAIVRPADLDGVMEICQRWEVRSTVVGHVNATGRLRILDGFDGDVLADVPAASLHEDAPVYSRPMQPPADRAALAMADPDALPAPSADDCANQVLDMLWDTSWVWTQYDHQLFLNTVRGPGDDAAVLRLKAPGLTTSCGLALTTDSNTRWCSLDPRRGTALVVAEAALNLACQGARSLAVVNCLNFGNPEHPEVMWQLSEAIDGMSEACVGLGLPVVGGNVSLYNESDGRDIRPTPVIGMVGLIESLDRRPPGAGLVEGGRLVALGHPIAGGLAGSRWAADVHGERGGRLPDLDLEYHASLCELIRLLVADGLLAGAHDVADGGLAVTLAEMAVRSGVGFRISEMHHAALFSESPSRVVGCVIDNHVAQVVARATAVGVDVVLLGEAGGDVLEVEGRFRLSLEETTRRWRRALPEAVSGPTTGAVGK